MKLAFVAPFFGAGAAGGAEAECRETALRLAARGHEIDIFTTCLLDLQHDWNVDAHPVGESRDGPLTLHRFRADKTDPLLFARLNTAAQSGRASDAQARAFAAHHINSAPLLRALAARRDAYDWIVFIPYLFGTTLYGSRLCPEKAVLIPCLHDEGYARLSPVRDLFARCARIVFHVPSEQRLAEQLYGSLGVRARLIGEGVETGHVGDAERFRRRFGIDGPFLLCCGRKDESKNTPALLRDFAVSAASRTHGLRLVLIGPGTVPLPPAAGDRVIDLGFVSIQEKFDAYAAACLLVQPSRNESFSLVLMEAWDLACPALVNGDCAVLRDHVVAANGGLAYRNPAEFDACLDWFCRHPAEAATLGRSGQKYAHAHYHWDRVLDRWESEVLQQTGNISSAPGQRPDAPSETTGQSPNCRPQTSTTA